MRKSHLLKCDSPDGQLDYKRAYAEDRKRNVCE